MDYIIYFISDFYFDSQQMFVGLVIDAWKSVKIKTMKSFRSLFIIWKFKIKLYL